MASEPPADRAPGMARLPLFPLGAVLFPGLVMPLHVFEDRYRSLVRNLLALPEGNRREFGVIAIRRGWEVATGSAAVTLYEVGCTAEVRDVAEHPDGRFDVVTVGRSRFAIRQVITGTTPYLQADIEYLPEPSADQEADRLGPRVLASLRTYLGLLHSEESRNGEQLPEDPQVLSYLVAATMALGIEDRQALLAAPDAASRLRAELALLHRETGLLRNVRAVPVAISELPVHPGPN